MRHGRSDAGADGLPARLRRLCEERHVVALVRKRTRVHATDLMSDASLVELTCSTLAQPNERAPLATEPDDVLVSALEAGASRVLRGCLVTALTDRHDLTTVARDACRRAGIEGREPALAYCLVVLCMKDDGPRRSGDAPGRRTYGLDPGEDGFADALRTWADTVAANLRDSASDYEAIQDEDARREYGSIRRLASRGGPSDGGAPGDVVDTALDALAATLASGPRLRCMSPAALLIEEPAAGQYAFQSPLRRWVRTSLGRRLPRRTAELKPDDDLPAPANTEDDDERLAQEIHRRLVAHVARLAETRALLSVVVASVDRLQRRADDVTSLSADARGLFNRFRAELGAVADELRAEQRAFVPTLAYILLALRPSPKRQHVAILSLRSEALDPYVVAHIAGQMRALTRADDQPSASLVIKTSRAEVPRSRALELTRLQADMAHRDAAVAALDSLLSRLPPTVADLVSIGAAVPGRMSARSVATTRGQAADELGTVDAAFRQVFRRYAMAMR